MYSNERVITRQQANAINGLVIISPLKMLWVGSVFLVAIIGGWLTLSWDSVIVFIVSTTISLCLGHSLGMHRRLIHKSYECH